MKTFFQLQKEINEWSKANFGNNETGLFGPKVELNHLCSLMGLAEEVGELADAGGHIQLSLDALGDIGIYLCDYASRTLVELPDECSLQYAPDAYMLNGINGIVASIGKLHHANLKRIQKIRGFDQDDVFAKANAEGIYSLLVYCGKYTRTKHRTTTFNAVVNMTWTEIVKKRDWKLNNQDGEVTTPTTGGAVEAKDE